LAMVNKPAAYLLQQSPLIAIIHFKN